MADYFSGMAAAEAAPLEEQIRQSERIYNTSKGNLEADNRRALRELYVGRMNAERDLPQRLSAYGMTGGLAETSELDLRNNYLRGRSRQEEGFGRNLADLTNRYQGEVGGLRAQIAAIQGRYAAEAAREAARGAARQAASRGGNGSGGVTVQKVTGLYDDIYRYYDGNGNFLYEEIAASPDKSANLAKYSGYGYGGSGGSSGSGRLVR